MRRCQAQLLERVLEIRHRVQKVVSHITTSHRLHALRMRTPYVYPLCVPLRCTLQTCVLQCTRLTAAKEPHCRIRASVRACACSVRVRARACACAGACGRAGVCMRVRELSHRKGRSSGGRWLTGLMPGSVLFSEGSRTGAGSSPRVHSSWNSAKTASLSTAGLAATT